MGKATPRVRYEPGPAFEEVKEEAMLDISPADSTEFWLIQWPKDQIDFLDFHGKELSLKLRSDGNMGSLESSSGKSYELVSFAAQKPDATVFLPSGSETKPGSKKTMSRFTSASKNRSSQGSALSLGQRSAEPTSKHKGKRKDESSLGHSNVSGKSSQGSQAGGVGSNMASEMPQSPSEKSQKKRKKVKIVE